MNKQTYPIPEGYKAISMEIIDNTIVTTFEPQFKRGDVLISTRNDGAVCVLDKIMHGDLAVEIVGVINGKITFTEGFKYFDYVSELRHATPEEAHRLWDALAKVGKRWNPETMEVEEIKKDRWRAEKGGEYHYILYDDTVYRDVDLCHADDTACYKTGNYFCTREQAQRAAEKIKQALADFWKEELK